MLQDVINRQEQLSNIESISSPLAAQILDFGEEDCHSFFADDLPDSDNSMYCPITGDVNDTTSASITNNAAANCESEGMRCYVNNLPASDNSTGCQTIGNVTATNSAPNNTTSAASCDSGGLCCYLGDDASFDFDPDTISSLLDCDQPYNYEPSDVIPVSTAASDQLPATSAYIGEQKQDELNQLPLSDAMNSGNWPLDSPDSVIPLDMDTDTRPRWVPWPCNNNPDRVVPLPEGQPIQTMPQLMGYMGMDSLPTCTFLDTSIISRYQPMCSGDEQMGFFHGRMLMNAEAGMGAEGGVGGVYGAETTQRVYNPIDMQVMEDFKSLVDGCDSNSTSLPTSDITPLEDSTLKVSRLSPEERKEKIHRYLKKRTERNFNKKIKYACRKTLADSRPRVRGRFAKNDDHSEGTTRPNSSYHEYYDEEEVVVKEEDMLNSSDIFTSVSVVNSFNYNYRLESWI